MKLGVVLVAENFVLLHKINVNDDTYKQQQNQVHFQVNYVFRPSDFDLTLYSTYLDEIK